MSFDRIEENVLAAVASDVPFGFRLHNSPKDLEIVLAKYGFLDLDFVTPRDLLTSAERIDRSTIRELGYSPRPPDPTPEIEPEVKKQLGSDRSCLEVLMESVKEQTTYLSLFLNSDYARDAMVRGFKEAERHVANGMTGVDALNEAVFSVAEKMKKSFPITFAIEDACLSNSSPIWLAKHAYL